MGASSFEHPAQQSPRSEEVRLRRAFGDAKLLGNLGVFVAGDIVQYKYAPRALGKARNRILEIQPQSHIGRGRSGIGYTRVDMAI